MPRVSFATKADYDAEYRLKVLDNKGRDYGVRIGYSRAVRYVRHQERAQKLVDAFGWSTSTRILLVGAGFAWTAESLEVDHGYSNIVTVDTSPWIQSVQDETEEAEVDARITAAGLDPASGSGLQLKQEFLGRGTGNGNRRRHSRAVMDEDLSNNGSRNRVRGVLGDIDVGITEATLSTLEDAEVVALIDRVNQINASMSRVHMVVEKMFTYKKRQRTESQLPEGYDPADVSDYIGQDSRYNWKTLAEWKLLVPTDTFMSLNGGFEVL